MDLEVLILIEMLNTLTLDPKITLVKPFMPCEAQRTVQT